MKNKLPLLAFLAAITFAFSSCKSLTNFSIEKRQHRGGYYVDWGNGKVKADQPTRSEARKAKTQEQEKQVASAPSKALAPDIPAAIQSTTSTSGNASQKKETPVKNSFRIKDHPVAQAAGESMKKSERNFSKSESYFEKRNSDTPDWVLAVLCILLPPLAVFLEFGISSEFWISILLTILFWIPGVIYAFVVIF